MDSIWVLGPLFGAAAGYFFGLIMRERSFTHNTGWVYTYVIFGALWGLSSAAMHAQNNKDKYKGELLTEVNDRKRKKELRKQKKEMRKAKRSKQK